MKDPEKPEFDWHGEHTTESLIDNEIYSSAVRNAMFLSEIRHEKMGIIN